MQEIATLSKKEIKATLIETHRENQIFWRKWLNQTKDFSEKSGLYRYREGFDTAILNLAQRLRITLGASHIPPETQEKKLRLSSWKESPFFLMHKESSAFIATNLFLEKVPSVGTARPVR